MRRLRIAALSLALLGAILAPAFDAHAAPPGSVAHPFAGTYQVQAVQGGGMTAGSRAFWIGTVTISSTGRISGTANYFPSVSGWGPPESPPGDGSARGSLSEDGVLHLSLSDHTTTRIVAQLAPDAEGNLLGVTPDWSWSVGLYPQ